MFGFGAGTSSIISAGRHDADKERAPPPLPTPLTFPVLPESFLHPPSPASHGQPSALAGLFARLKKPTDVKHEHLSLFNISFQSPLPLDQFFADTPVPAYLPLETSDDQPQDQDAKPSQGELLSNGRPVPTQRDFQIRVNELQLDNQKAFSALSRMAAPGQTPPRLVHLRRFWDGLDNMAYYWDSSQDQYIPPHPTVETETSHSYPAHRLSPGDGASTAHLHEPKKKAKMGHIPSWEPSDSTKGIHPAFEIFRLTGNELPSLPTRTNQPRSPPAAKAANRPASAEATDTPSSVYKGNRIGTGKGMPEQYRIDTVRAFMEAICWAFGVSLSPHRKQPVLSIGNVRFPVRVTNAAWKAPADRLKARAGWLEGPILGIQVRPEVDFTADDAGILDALRELGGLIYTAQERARDGQTERKPGEGSWWTTVPRWGGGPGGEIGEARGEDSGDGVIQREAEEKRKQKDLPRERASSLQGRLGGLSSKPRKKLNAIETWKELKPGTGSWDPRVHYQAIGKQEGSDWDDTFLVSSINHHISILKLRVHHAYLDHMTTGIFPSPEPADARWSSPELKRTRWYDFFKKDDRVEAMRAIWGILAYLMRPRQEEKGDTLMTD